MPKSRDKWDDMMRAALMEALREQIAEKETAQRRENVFAGVTGFSLDTYPTLYLTYAKKLPPGFEPMNLHAFMQSFGRDTKTTLIFLPPIPKGVKHGPPN